MLSNFRKLPYHKVYSNAGFLFMGTVLRQLASRDRDLAKEFWIHAVAGIVFDSAPARLTPDMAARCVLSL